MPKVYLVMADGGLTSHITPVNGALVESWTLSLHGKAPRTVEHYLDEVWRFAGRLADHGRPTAAPGDLLAAERKDVEAWLMAQRTAGLSQATMRNRWVALRDLYGSAVAEEEIERSPLDRVVVAKANTPVPDVLTGDELKVCAGGDFYARRDPRSRRPEPAISPGVAHRPRSVPLPVTDEGDAELVRMNMADAGLTGPPVDEVDVAERQVDRLGVEGGESSQCAWPSCRATFSAWGDGSRRRSCVRSDRGSWPLGSTGRSNLDMNASRAAEVDPDDASGGRGRLLLGRWKSRRSRSTTATAPRIHTRARHGSHTCHQLGPASRACPPPYLGPPWPGQRRHSLPRHVRSRPQWNPIASPRTSRELHATRWTEADGDPNRLTCGICRRALQQTVGIPQPRKVGTEPVQRTRARVAAAAVYFQRPTVTDLPSTP